MPRTSPRVLWVALLAAMVVTSAAANAQSADNVPETPPALPSSPGPGAAPGVAPGADPTGRPSGRANHGSTMANLEALCTVANTSPELVPLCSVLQTQRARLAAEPAVPLGGSGRLPPNYYSARLGVDVCAIIRPMNDKEVAKEAKKVRTKPSLDPTTALENLKAACGEAAPRAGSIQSLGVEVVQGLGNFLAARAKEEVVEFAVEKKAKTLCTGALTRYFVKSCPVLFPPNGKTDPPDLESAVDGRLQTALRADLEAFPGRLLVSVVDAKAPRKRQLDDVLQAIGNGAVAAFRDGQLSDVFGDALSDLPDSEAASFACQLGDASTPSPPACVAAFMLEVGATAVKEGGADPVRVLNDAASAFCDRFGEKVAGMPGQCILGASGYLAIDAKAKAVVAAADNLTKAPRASIKPGTESTMRFTAAELRGLRGVLAAMLDGVRVAPGGTSVPIGDVMDLVSDVIAFAKAIAAKDSADALVAAEDIVVTIAKIDPKLAPDSKTFAFVLAIATAKSSADVEAAFDAAAAPVGSYRRKYSHSGEAGGLLTVNGFVGYSLGGIHPLHRAADVDDWQFFQRLRMPVGLDLNIWGWTAINLGLGLTVIDPLALTVVTKDGAAVAANWASVLDLGGYLRIGIFGSPFNLFLAASYNPGLEPSGGCATAATGVCWRGAWQLGGGLVVDVPIFPLY